MNPQSQPSARQPAQQCVVHNHETPGAAHGGSRGTHPATVPASTSTAMITGSCSNCTARGPACALAPPSGVDCMAASRSGIVRVTLASLGCGARTKRRATARRLPTALVLKRTRHARLLASNVGAGGVCGGCGGACVRCTTSTRRRQARRYTRAALAGCVKTIPNTNFRPIRAVRSLI